MKTENPQNIYRQRTLHKNLLLVGLLGILILVAGISIALGPMDIGLRHVYGSLIQAVTGADLGIPDKTVRVITLLRVPRALWAILAGTAFGIAGTIMQTVLRNPLASPFTLGISAGANLGVSVAIILGLNITDTWLGVIGNAFLFAILTSTLIIGMASIKKASIQMIVLAGIGINYILRAATNFLEYIATPEQLEMTLAFGRGELGAFGYRELGLSAIVITAACLIIFPQILDLNAISFGDEKAKSLGIRVGLSRVGLMFTSSCMVAVAVAFVGPIGFIGLAGPHMARSLIGTNHVWLLPASMLLGSILLLCADILATNLLGNTVIPIGIMTSLFGAPFFLYFIFKEKRDFWR